MAWLFILVAIVGEVCATLALKVASGAKPRWYSAVVLGYVAALVFLTLALDAGMGIGVAYGVWAAVGVAATALASRILFKEALTAVMGAGITLIVAGVLLIELGASAAHHG